MARYEELRHGTVAEILFVDQDGIDQRFEAVVRETKGTPEEGETFYGAAIEKKAAVIHPRTHTEVGGALGNLAITIESAANFII